jgi:1,4-alpha-glucan branching enzyme
MPAPHRELGPPKPPWSTIYFRLEAPEAKRVCVTGDFNDWREEKHHLHRNPNGVWECQIPLPPGRYRYIFVVDGARRADPACAQRVQTDAGEACVIEVAASNDEGDAG